MPERLNMFQAIQVDEGCEASQCRTQLMGSAHLLESLISQDTGLSTRGLTRVIGDYCQSKGARVAFEVPIDIYRTTIKKKGGVHQYQGRVDVVAEFPDGSKLAVEIDTNFKRWSLAKLRRAQKLNFIELWVRWDGPRTCIHGVSVLNVHHDRRCYVARRQITSSTGGPARPDFTNARGKANQDDLAAR